MSNVCEITGKRPTAGSNVSHSNRHTRRSFRPNLREVTIWEGGRKKRIKVSMRALKKLRIK
ncbi:MAG TPA: 50S ribosomal protein L28 [bacterium]|nr:50S ribosomal protein L28 [bacterium]